MANANGDVTHEEGGPRSFSVFLTKVGEGDCEQQLSQEMQTLMKAVIAQAKAQSKAVTGTLSLTLSFAGEDTGVVNVRYEIKRKEPKPRRPTSVFWIGRDGNVVDENPKQKRLPFRDVSAKNEVREVDGSNKQNVREV